MTTILVFAIIALIMWLWISYNHLVPLRESCRAAAANIDTQLARRYDLYVKATSVLSSGSDFERDVFQKITELRTRNDLALEQKVDQIGQLFAVAESNPTVNSVELFRHMQSAVFETETLIQTARETFNAQAKAYNTVIQQLPMNIAAGLLRFAEIPYFTHTE